MTTLPFLTTYDPPGRSEGPLDPLGLYQIADQLAFQLVPSVREQMQRIRCLTAMAVGAIITEDLESDVTQPDAAPCFVWEWFLAEALVRELSEDDSVWGWPGTQVARHALASHGYLDARSYLKTPRTVGFNGVYKRLALHLGIVNVNLAPSRNTDRVVDAWARDLGLHGIKGAKSLLTRWKAAVERSLGEKPPRTKPGWTRDSWGEMARAFSPAATRRREKRVLRDLLVGGDDQSNGCLPAIWQLQAQFDDSAFREETLHLRLEKREPVLVPLLVAIRAYEGFARNLQDAFDTLRSEATHSDAHGFIVPEIVSSASFKTSVRRLHKQFEETRRALSNVAPSRMSLQNLFVERFGVFAEAMTPDACAIALCAHHEEVQRRKLPGKRSWFDRIGPERIYVRHAYRRKWNGPQPGRYLHQYRGWPIRRFHTDLS